MRFFYHRLLHSRIFYLGIIIELLIVIGYSETLFEWSYYGSSSYNSPWYTWIGTFTPQPLPNLLFFIMPLLASLYLADIVIIDRNSGLINTLFSKGLRHTYFTKLFWANFFMSGAGFMLPIFLSLWSAFMAFQNQLPDFIADSQGIVQLIHHKITLFPSLFFDHPYLHLLMYLTLMFVSVAIYASIALTISLFINNRFVVYLIVFLLNYAASLLLLSVNFRLGSLIPSMSSRQLSTAISPEALPVFGSLIVLAMVTGTLYWWRTRRYNYD